MGESGGPEKNKGKIIWKRTRQGEFDCSPLCGALITPLMSETGVVCLYSAPNEGIREQRRTSPILTSPLKKNEKASESEWERKGKLSTVRPNQSISSFAFCLAKGKKLVCWPCTRCSSLSFMHRQYLHSIGTWCSWFIVTVLCPTHDWDNFCRDRFTQKRKAGGRKILVTNQISVCSSHKCLGYL